MAPIAIVTALVLILQGLIGYYGADLDSRSPTALIPLFFGLPIGIAGLIALKEKFHKHAMHAAVTFGLLGALASWGRSVPNLIKMAQGAEINQRATTMVLVMAIICTIFVALCIKSFVDARKRQKADTNKDDEAVEAADQAR